MQSRFNPMRSLALLSSVAIVIGSPAMAAKPKYRAKAPVVRSAPPVGIQRPSGEMAISQGRGQLINLPVAITDIFVSNDAVADVQVKSARQLYIFGKSRGETSVYATNAAGAVVFSSNVRVGNNLNSLDQMLAMALPDANIQTTTMNGLVLLTGTIQSPDDSAEAERLVTAFIADPATRVVSRLRSATPLQVTLQVRIAEVSRSFVKEIGVNWRADNGPATNTGTRFDISNRAASGDTTLNLSGRLLGLNVLSALDLGETEGFVTTLATPNLTALSGEVASFIAGGTIPIPTAQVTGGGTTTSIEYKSYGVSLDFSPTVLADGRIQLRVKPEVSELDYSNAIRIGGADIPGTTIRKVETTVELGSGQSFVIGGLMRANNSTTFQKTPGVGDVPVLGALFRSNSWKRGESELMVVVTPYLVNPVPASQIVLPTDGYRTPTELGRLFKGDLYKGVTEKRPLPSVAPSQTIVQPGVGAAASAPSNARGTSAPAPGFSK